VAPAFQVLPTQFLKLRPEPDVLNATLHDVRKLLIKGDVFTTKSHIPARVHIKALEQPGTGETFLRRQVCGVVTGFVLVVAPGEELPDLHLVDNGAPMGLGLIHVHALLVDDAGDDASGRLEPVSDVHGHAHTCVQAVPVQIGAHGGIGFGIASVHAELDGVNPGANEGGEVLLVETRAIGDKPDATPFLLGVEDVLHSLGVEHGLATAGEP